MGNLGSYQVMTALAKRVGGPKVLVAVIASGGYALLRPAEAVVKKAFRSLRTKSVPCATKGLHFEVVSDCEDGGGLRLRAGDAYRVLECDGDAILIEVFDAPDNPHFVSGEFLATVSGFPAEGSAKRD